MATVVPSSASTLPASVLASAPVVLGGGPCGSFAAALLASRGAHVTLIEQTADFLDFDVTRSYALRITIHGRNALSAVPGLQEHIAAHGEAVGELVITARQPDGTSAILGRRPAPVDGRRDLRFVRAGLLQGMKSYVEACDGINALYGTVVKGVTCSDDGEMEVLLETDGRPHSVRTRLIIACDGRKSIAGASLEAAEDASLASSSRTCKTVSYNSPAVGLFVKSLALSPDVVNSPSDPPDSRTGHTDHVLALVGDLKRPSRKRFNIAMFRTPPSYIAACGGVLGTIVRPRGYEVWEIENVDGAYDFFQKNLPQLNVHDIISQDAMAAFVKAKPSVFPPIQRRLSLVAHVGKSQSGGVVFLGEAAHSFPPDIGQGANAAFQDVAVLAGVLDDAPSETSLEDLLKRYEELREVETEAITKLARVAAPYQYGQSKVGQILYELNKLLRKKLAIAFSGVLYPSMADMLSQDLPYSEIVRRADMTTRRLLLALASLVFVPIFAVIAQQFL